MIAIRPSSVGIDDWVPMPNRCHDNTAIWVQHNPTHKAVPGFLLFDFGGYLNIVRFAAHSVIETEAGDLVDITPSQATVSYPFIRHAGSDEVLELAGRMMNLDYVKPEAGDHIDS